MSINDGMFCAAKDGLYTEGAAAGKTGEHGACSACGADLEEGDIGQCADCYDLESCATCGCDFPAGDLDGDGNCIDCEFDNDDDEGEDQDALDQYEVDNDLSDA